MDYGYIVNRSFSIAIKNKTLWFFGMFAGFTSSFNIDFGQSAQFNTDLGEPLDFDLSPEVLGGVVLAWFSLMLFFFALNAIADAALIDGVNHIERGGEYSFGKSYSRGLDFFWRSVGMSILQLGIFGAFFFVLAIFTVITVFIGLIVTIPAMIAGGFVIWTIFFLAKRAMVVRDTSITAAIEEGYALFMANKVECLKIFLIFIVITIGFGVIGLFIALGIYAPLNGMINMIFEQMAAALVIGMIVALPISILFGGYTGTALSSMYTLFYFQLVDPGSQEIKDDSIPPQDIIPPKPGPSFD